MAIGLGIVAEERRSTISSRDGGAAMIRFTSLPMFIIVASALFLGFFLGLGWMAIAFGRLMKRSGMGVKKTKKGSGSPWMWP